MVKTIIWNRRASNSFNAIIEYLQEEWGDKVLTVADLAVKKVN